MTKSNASIKIGRSASSGRFLDAKKPGTAIKPITKRGSISEAEAERAVRGYLVESQKK